MSAESILLATEWQVWVRPINSNDWSINAYTRLMKLLSMKDFWGFINNIDVIGKQQHDIFIMKENILPMWEDNHNKNGCIYSLCDNLHNFNEIFEKIFILSTEKSLIHKDKWLNGLSIQSKNDWFILKLWISKEISEQYIITDFIKSLSKTMTIKCKNNTHR
jgi:hypothetical protein